jgi:hypothetical protein
MRKRYYSGVAHTNTGCLLLRGRLLFVFFALRDASQTLCKHLSYLVEKNHLTAYTYGDLVAQGAAEHNPEPSLLALLVFALGVPVKA